MTSRRPISARESGWARRLATRLAASAITPNQISQASMAFALLGFLCFWATTHVGAFLGALLLILAAAAIQARLICNLLDGMVAVEGGKSSPTGPFWNEAPDRVADTLLLWGAGIAAHQPALGLACAAAAIATAYLRELGRAEGFPPDFSGPMAKPHRMAALTAGSSLAAVLTFAYAPQTTLLWTLWIILVGTALTIARRSHRLLAALSNRL